MLILICTGLNGAGFAWNLFEPIPLYDEIAHFLTPFTLVAILAEIIYRGEGDDEFFNTPRPIRSSTSCLASSAAAREPGRPTATSTGSSDAHASTPAVPESASAQENRGSHARLRNLVTLTR